MSDRALELRRQRRKLLQLDAAGRLDQILESRRPAELVRLLPAQQFFATALELGTDRAGPVLAHASPSQLDITADLGMWDDLELDPQKAAEWLAAFRRADPDLIERWLMQADEHTVVLVLSKLLRVYKLDESTDQQFWPPQDRQLSTLDGVYFLEERDADGVALDGDAIRGLWEGLAQLRSRNTNAYQALLEQVLWSIPTETEHTAWEARRSRLEEWGFPDLEDALESVSPGDAVDPEVRRAAAKSFGADANDAQLVARDPKQTFFEAALDGLDDVNREVTFTTLARLANRHAAASGRSLGQLETHSYGLALATALVNLGLSELASSGAQPSAALGALGTHEIARLGLGAARERAVRAERLLTGWLAKVYDAKARLPELWEAMLDALVSARVPRVAFEGLAAPIVPSDIEQLRAADDVLLCIEQLGTFAQERLGANQSEFASLADVSFEGRSQSISWVAIAWTALLRGHQGERLEPRPLTPVEVDSAIETLIDTDSRGPSPAAQTLVEPLPNPLSAYLLARLKDDLAGLAATSSVDPRYVSVLLIAAPA